MRWLCLAPVEFTASGLLCPRSLAQSYFCGICCFRSALAQVTGSSLLLEALYVHKNKGICLCRLMFTHTHFIYRLLKWYLIVNAFLNSRDKKESLSLLAEVLLEAGQWWCTPRQRDSWFSVSSRTSWWPPKLQRILALKTKKKKKKWTWSYRVISPKAFPL